MSELRGANDIQQPPQQEQSPPKRKKKKALFKGSRNALEMVHGNVRKIDVLSLFNSEGNVSQLKSDDFEKSEFVNASNEYADKIRTKNEQTINEQTNQINTLKGNVKSLMLNNGKHILQRSSKYVKRRK